MHRYVAGLLVLLVLLCIVPLGAFAGDLTVQGKASISVLPSVLRAQFTVTNRGESLEKAVAGLAGRKQAAHQKLLAAGAIGRSIRFGETTVGSATTSKVVSKRSLRLGAETAEWVNVSTIVTADWPLNVRTADELLVNGRALQQRVASVMNAEPTAGSAVSSVSASASSKSVFRSAQFEFVAWLGEPEHVGLLQRAFHDARRRAARVAFATQQTLGPLVDLNATGDLDSAPKDDTHTPKSIAGPALPADSRLVERVTRLPSPVKFRTMLVATFSLSSDGPRNSEPVLGRRDGGTVERNRSAGPIGLPNRIE